MNEKVIPPAKEDLYRLPWSMTDNPIGWVEITDICNIHCKGCYRLVLGEGHKPLEKIKEEILFMKKWRNCDGITLAGGEPILHPEIREIIRFIHENKMKSIVLTNGYGINEKLVKDLKELGVTGFSFHIDSTQTRPDKQKKQLKSEMELNDIRLRVAELLRKYKMYAHFGITVTPQSLPEVPAFIQWAIDHMDMVNGISLIIYRGIPVTPGMEYYAGDKKINLGVDGLGYAVDEEGVKDIGITSKEVYSVIKEHFPGYEACAYLGGTADHTSYKWLIGNIMINDKGKVFGGYGKRAMEITQTYHHFSNGTYLVYPHKRIGKKVLLAALFDKQARKAAGNYFRYVLANPARLFRPLHVFGIGIVQAPDMMPDGRMNMCDDCPDMCVYEGKLVYSCRLDEYRQYGDLLHVHHADENGKPEVAEPMKVEEPVLLA